MEFGSPKAHRQVCSSFAKQPAEIKKKNKSHCTVGRHKIKKVPTKKLVKSNKAISEIFFDQIPFFCNFKNGQKSVFELG